MKPVLLALVVVIISLTGCQDRYRYACQDPRNFGTSACNPPACEANGTCTKYLVGDPNEQ